MRPEDARTRIEYCSFLSSQIVKLELKLPKWPAQNMFNSLNSNMRFELCFELVPCQAPMKSVKVKFSDGSSAVPNIKDGCFSNVTSRVYRVLLKDKTVLALAQVIS